MLEFLGTLRDVFNAFPAWIVAITSVLTACTAITALTKTEADNKILNVVLKVLNVLAGNVYKNKNADASK